jgi:hypothetical protein
MPSDNNQDDAAIIQAAYAERIREAFRVFAESLAMGEAERGSRDRFVRSIEQTRKAREVALEAIIGTRAATEAETDAAVRSAAQAASTYDGLSDEERAMIEQALAGTTGQRAPTPLPSETARSPLMRR